MLNIYFDIVCGKNDVVVFEMIKWFNMNYYYIVLEFVDVELKVLDNWVLYYYEEVKKEFGIEGKLVFVGLIIYLKFGKGSDVKSFEVLLDKFILVYVEILKEFEVVGVKWV